MLYYTNIDSYEKYINTKQSLENVGIFKYTYYRKHETIKLNLFYVHFISRIQLQLAILLYP